MVGTFAVGVVAVTILSTVCPLGLSSFLPRVRQPHAKLCFAGIALQFSVLPLVVALLLLYTKLFAQSAGEERIVFLVALSGFAIGLSNTGLMLSIMVRRFYPATVAPVLRNHRDSGRWLRLGITRCGRWLHVALSLRECTIHLVRDADGTDVMEANGFCISEKHQLSGSRRNRNMF